MRPGVLDNREYDAEAWGRELIPFAPPFAAWSVVGPGGETFIVTDSTGEVLSAGDAGEGFVTLGAAQAVARHFEVLRRDAWHAERQREIEADATWRPRSASAVLLQNAPRWACR